MNSFSWVSLLLLLAQPRGRRAALIPDPTSTYSSFNDTFAREKMLPIVAASYADKPEKCLMKFFPGSAVSYNSNNNNLSRA